MRLQAVWTALGISVCSFIGMTPSVAVGQEVKAKPPLYSYVANWEMPREKFKDMMGVLNSNDALMKKLLAEGNIVAFGSDVNILHQPGEWTHDTWWSSMSMGGLMKAMEATQGSVANSSAVLASGKHDDKLFVSRYYNWRSGPFTNGYTRFSTYKFKAGAPDDALDQMAKQFVVPMYEKLLAEGAIYEYEIDQEIVHTTDGNNFYIVVIANGPDGLDKATAALAGARNASPFALTTFGSWSEMSAHRDSLGHTTATYK